MKPTVYYKLERAKSFIKFFIEKYSPTCCLCGHKMRWEVFFPKFSGFDKDDWTIHHLNHNRENNKPENLELCHRDCHRRHHREEQLFKEVNPKKKYTYSAIISSLNNSKKTFRV